MSKNGQAIFLGAVKRKTKHISVVLAALMVLTAVPVYASTSVNNNVTQPQVSGAFAVSAAAASSYVDPTNGFTDGSPKYYLITQDSAKFAATEVTYNGVTYTLTNTYVGNDISVAAARGFFAPNSTVFFDSGTYNDSAAIEYTRFSVENLSLIGLNGASATTLTKSAYTNVKDMNTYDTIERYNIAAQNVYFQGITFDGENHNLYSKALTKASRGDCLFFFSGGDPKTVNGQTRYLASDGLVMKDCIIQNVGADNSNPNYINQAINIYQSDGQHNFENLQIKNVKTCLDNGIVGMNHTTNNYFKNLTIDGTQASPFAYSVKIEAKSTSASVPDNTVKTVFSGSLNLTQANSTNNVYIQKYEFISTVVPAAYQYAQYNGANGSNSSSAINVYSALPAASSLKAVLDLKDNYWIVRSGDKVSVEDQLKAIKSAIAAARAAKATPPSTNIKLVASSGSIGAFTIPDFGSSDNVNIVAVGSATDSFDSTAQIPLSATAAITFPTANASKIKLYDFDFDSNLKYTLQEVINGITPAAVTLTDPYETASIPGYPIYSSYKPSAVVPAKIAGSTADNFANCKFASLVNEIKIANPAAAMTVGKSITFTAQLKDTATNSYTAASYTGTVKNTANDQTIHWFSSDPSIVSIDQTTGKAAAIKAGTVTIIAKAMDANNNGEIEKPFDSIQLKVSADTGVINIPDDPTPTGGGIVSSDGNPVTGDSGIVAPMGIFLTGLLVSAGITLIRRFRKKHDNV